MGRSSLGPYEAVSWPAIKNSTFAFRPSSVPRVPRGSFKACVERGEQVLSSEGLYVWSGLSKFLTGPRWIYIPSSADEKRTWPRRSPRNATEVSLETPNRVKKTVGSDYFRPDRAGCVHRLGRSGYSLEEELRNEKGLWGIHHVLMMENRSKDERSQRRSLRDAMLHFVSQKR